MNVNGGRAYSFQPMVEGLRDNHKFHVFLGATEQDGQHWITATFPHKSNLCHENIMVGLDGRLIGDETDDKVVREFDIENWYNTNTYSIGKAIKYLYDNKYIGFFDKNNIEIQKDYDFGIIALRKVLFYGLYAVIKITVIFYKIRYNMSFTINVCFIIAYVNVG